MSSFRCNKQNNNNYDSLRCLLAKWNAFLFSLLLAPFPFCKCIFRRSPACDTVGLKVMGLHFKFEFLIAVHIFCSSHIYNILYTNCFFFLAQYLKWVLFECPLLCINASKACFRMRATEFQGRRRRQLAQIYKSDNLIYHCTLPATSSVAMRAVFLPRILHPIQRPALSFGWLPKLLMKLWPLVGSHILGHFASGPTKWATISPSHAAFELIAWEANPLQIPFWPSRESEKCEFVGVAIGESE